MGAQRENSKLFCTHHPQLIMQHLLTPAFGRSNSKRAANRLQARRQVYLCHHKFGAAVLFKPSSTEQLHQIANHLPLPLQ